MEMLSWITKWLQCNQKGLYKRKAERDVQTETEGQSLREVGRERLEEQGCGLKVEAEALSQGVPEAIRS